VSVSLRKTPFRVDYGVAMKTTPHGWNIFDADIPILTYTYSFGPGMANALAVGGRSGLIIVSPPYRATRAVVEDLSPYGRVLALIASNAFHHMGVPEWKRQFPEAAIFAPAQAVARVERQTRLGGIRPLADASAITGPRLDLIDMPHYRTGEVLVRMRTDRGVVWYVTDVILNMPTLPTNPIIKILFKLSGNAPGLKFNNIAPVFMAKDKKAVKCWLAAEYQKEPPLWLIATHGDIADLAANPNAVRDLLVTS
jgi:hypothetical protein